MKVQQWEARPTGRLESLRAGVLSSVAQPLPA